MGLCNGVPKSIKNSDQTLVSNPTDSHQDSTSHSDEAHHENQISEKTKYVDIKTRYAFSGKFLGKGGSGIVFEAIELSTGKRYAIKRVEKHNEQSNEWLKEEISITLDLKHEGVIQCHEIIEDSSNIYFVLELMNQGDLFDYITQSNSKKLSEKEAMNILYQILETVRYLHNEARVVHRDIKPENFLIWTKKGEIKIKLIDFGFATYIPQDELMDEGLGTSYYASPEIIMGEKYTSKVDMWAVGVVLYNMVTGRQPFKNDWKMAERIIDGEVDFSGFSNCGLKQLCMNLMCKIPEDRYDADEALEELALIYED